MVGGFFTLGGGEPKKSRDFGNVGSAPETQNEPIVKGTGMTQSQIDASFNPEKEIVYGTPESALRPQWEKMADAEAAFMRRRRELDNLFNGLDNLALGCFAIGFSPLVIGETLVLSPMIWSATSTEAGYIWGALKTYHKVVGIGAGGYVSIGGELANQGVNQYTRYGNVTFGRMDVIALGNSANPQTSFSAKFVQGITPTFISYSTDDGFSGAIAEKKSGSWIAGSLLNGTLGTLMETQPIIPGWKGDLMNKSFNGFSQGVIDSLGQH